MSAIFGHPVETKAVYAHCSSDYRGINAGCAVFSKLPARPYSINENLSSFSTGRLSAAQPPAAEKLLIDPHCCADEPQLLGANPGADLQAPTPDEERVQGAVRFVKLWAICEVVADYKHLIQLLHLQLLGCLGDLALPLDDVTQRCLVPLVVVGPLPFGIHPSSSMYFLTGIQPSSILMDGLKI